MKKNNKIRHAIVRTLSYSDVFDYPLRQNELWKFLNIRAHIDKNSFTNVLGLMVRERKLGAKNGYYFLNGREKIVDERLKRRKISIYKFGIAKKAASILSFIPTIKLVGVSGSLSQKNARLQDDIDFFIIAKCDSLWITRFLVNVLLIISGHKRSIRDWLGTDLICPNLFISEDELSLPILRRNLFSAREIAQINVLFHRDSMYKKFLSANYWIKDYLPNIKIRKQGAARQARAINILGFLDKTFYAFQFLYMSNRITGEEIRRKAAYFHPKDKSKMILKIYKMRYKRYSQDILQDIDKNLPFLYI